MLLRRPAAPVEVDRDRALSWTWEVTLRLAGPADHRALTTLAQLDSTRLGPGPHLVAERDGYLVAAISLCTGDVIADPFARTAELCALLRCHAGPERWPVPAQLVTATIAGSTASHAQRGSSCPRSSTSTSRAPGISRASAAP